MGRRILVTGLGTFWGGRMAQALEQDPSVDIIVGLDTKPPSVELERTEFVRVDENYSILARIVKATQVDTIVHTFLVVNSDQMRPRAMHEINVIGTMNLFAAASAAGSTVRNVVVKSSSLVYGSAVGDPTWFQEDTPRTKPPRNRVERSLIDVEGYVHDFAEDNPHVNVSLLRFSNVIGTETVTPLKPLEAMAQGRLLIASNVGGHRELIDDGRTGFLFRPDDPAARGAPQNVFLGQQHFGQAMADLGQRAAQSAVHAQFAVTAQNPLQPRATVAQHARAGIENAALPQFPPHLPQRLLQMGRGGLVRPKMNGQRHRQSRFERMVFGNMCGDNFRRRLAGVGGLEPTTLGFGDRCSTN